MYRSRRDDRGERREHRAWARVAVAIGAAAAFLLGGPSASGQESRGMIFGSVTDPSGAAVAAAKVTVTNLETSVSQPHQTNNTGYYEASLLNAGKYRVAVEAAGFKKAVREAIQLPVGTRLQVNFVLELGDVTESVSVVAEPPLLETTGVSSGQVIDNRVLQDLTLSGQNAVMAAKLAPGIQSGDTVGDVAGQPHSVGAGSRLYIAGGVGGNEFYIDGNPNGGRGRTVGYMPSAELIQEMKVETSGFDASIGHTTGVNVTMMTKVGTNAFHGSARFAHRQDRWGALGFFQKQAYYRSIAQAESQGNTALAKQLRDQGPWGKTTGRLSSWAGTLGGPLIVPRLFSGKNKLFFFVGMDGFGQGGSYFNQSTLPSMADRQGDFAPLLNVNATLYQIYDPLTVRSDPSRPGHFVRDPLPANVLPASRIVNPAYKFYSSLMPTPTVITDPKLDPVRNWEGVGKSWNRYKSVSNREDYHLSDKNRFFARWHWGRWDNWVPGWGYASPTIPAVDVYGYMRRNRAMSADWVNTLSAATVLDVAVSATQYTETQDWFGINPFQPSDVGLPAYMDAKAGDRHHLPIMSWSGYNNVGGQAKTEYNVRTMALKADLSHVRSSHTLRAGADLRGQYYTNSNPGVTSGAFSFSNTWTQRTDDGFTPAGSYGHSWAAFMMGLPSSLSVATNDSIATFNPYYAWYFQDNWRLARKLTLNFGLRFEYELGATERYNRVMGNFDYQAKLPITDAAQAAYAAKPVPELAAAQFVVKGGNLYPGVGGTPRRLWEDSLQWLPRLAAAYQMTSNTVLRAGYGLYYDTLNAMNQSYDRSFFDRTTSGIMTNDFGMNWLLGDPKNGVSPLKDPFPVRADGSRFDLPLRDALGLMTRVGRGTTDYNFDRRHARQQRWRVGIQRQFGATMVLEAAYAGSYSDHTVVTQTVAALPQQYWADGLVRNDANASNMNANVTNPFALANFAGLQSSNPTLYSDMRTNSFFTSGTIRKERLLRPFPQMNGLNQQVPLGEVKTHELIVSADKRFSSGFNLSVNYTRLSLRTADFYYNEFDPGPSWRDGSNGRPHVFNLLATYEFPFGKGKRFATAGLPNYLLGGFQLSIVHQWWPGPLVDWGNVFYYGNLAELPRGTRDIEQWFNTAKFERDARKMPAAYHRRVFPTRVDGVRADSTKDWSGNLQRRFKIRESLTALFRFEVYNLQNRSQFWMPNTTPTSTDFGRVTSQPSHHSGQGGSVNRWIQLFARIEF